MATVRDLIEGALRLIGIGVENEALTAYQYKISLSALNGMLDDWATQKLLVYTINRDVFALTPNKASYTLGTGGDFNVVRPTWIENASILLTANNPQYEMTISMLRDEEWREIGIKALTTTYPTYIYDQCDYPLRTIYVWPIPTVQCSLVLYLPGVLSEFSSINNVVQLPKGYERALRYNLAVELAPEYGLEASPTTMRIAANAKKNLRERNWQPMEMICDSALTSRSRISSKGIKSFGYVVD